MKKVLLSMMAVAALASCAKEEGNTPAPVDNNEITLVSNTVNAMTKAPIETSDLNGIARVLASETSGNYSTLYTGRDQTNTYINFAGASTEKGFVQSNGTTPAPAYYKDATSTVYLFGLYPSTWSLSSGNYTCTFDGKTDVMFAPEIGVTKSTEVAGRTMRFNHLLTKLNVQAKLSEGTADSWGTITSIILESANNQVAIANTALPTNATTRTDFNYSGSESIPFYVWETGGDYTDNAISNANMPTNDTEINVAYTLCAPVTADGNTGSEYTLHIVTSNGGTHDVNINLLQSDNSSNFTGSTSGYQFTIVLNFQSTEITATATVAPWSQGGEVAVPVGGDTQV